MTTSARQEHLLEVRDLRTWFPIQRGVIARTVGHVRAVDGVSLRIDAGETLGLVGESGCGKTTLARTIMRLDPAAAGEILFEGRNLLALDPPERLRLLAGIPGEDPTAPSITGVFAGADFYEREAFDLFGIVFPGHPDLTRILLPDDWQGHPLRKDTPVGSVPVQFKEANRAT